jgi:hypothetical protein
MDTLVLEFSPVASLVSHKCHYDHAQRDQCCLNFPIVNNISFLSSPPHLWEALRGKI